jgi:hypothetical protein
MTSAPRVVSKKIQLLVAHAVNVISSTLIGWFCLYFNESFKLLSFTIKA